VPLSKSRGYPIERLLLRKPLHAVRVLLQSAGLLHEAEEFGSVSFFVVANGVGGEVVCGVEGAGGLVRRITQKHPPLRHRGGETQVGRRLGNGIAFAFGDKFQELAGIAVGLFVPDLQREQFAAARRGSR